MLNHMICPFLGLLPFFKPTSITRPSFTGAYSFPQVSFAPMSSLLIQNNETTKKNRQVQCRYCFENNYTYLLWTPKQKQNFEGFFTSREAAWSWEGVGWRCCCSSSDVCLFGLYNFMFAMYFGILG